MSFQAVIGSLDVAALEPSGVQWSVNSMAGLGSSGSTISPIQKPRQSGAWAGDAFSTARHPALGGLIQAPTQDLLLDAKDRLIEAAALSMTRLSIVEASRSWSYLVRREDEVIFTYITDVVASWSVQFVALDSRKFWTPLTGSTPLPTTSGGLTVPYTVPYSIGSTTANGQITLTNLGNETGPVVLRIDGPAIGPVITHIGSALALVFSSSLVLGLGEWLTVDMEKHTAMANDQASRNGFITSRGWSGFEPGMNVWSFTAAVYDPASLLTVTATPASK